MTRLPAIVALSAVLAAGSAGADPGSGAPEVRAAAPASALEARLMRAEREVLALAPAVLTVERLYVREDAALAAVAVERRFSDAELHFLLGEYDRAAALLFDLVEEPRFRTDRRLASARYLLGESLYQGRDYPSALGFFRDQLLAGPGPEFDLGLARYLELSARLDDFTAADAIFELALAGEEGRKPERIYAVAKGTFRRTDLPAEERHARALSLFASLKGSRFEPRALYFAGVIAVEGRRFEEARRCFSAAIAAAPKEETELRELGELALARLAFEEGARDEALERYRKIPKESAHYAEALRELAVTSARNGDPEGALRAADLLLMAVVGTAEVPEARLLQARLCARTGRYAEAAKLYGEVAREIGPVRDRVLGELERHGDPVAYFEGLLRGKTGVEAAELIPKEALAYADPGPEVERALRVAGDLAEGAKALAEARELAGRLEAELARGDGLAASPGLAEGIGRANAALRSAVAAKRELYELEAGILGRGIPAELAGARSQAAAVEERYAPPPAEALAGLGRSSRLAAMEGEADRLGAELEAVDASLRASRAWLANPRRRRGPVSFEQALARDLGAEAERARLLRAEVDGLRRQVAAFRASEGASDDDGVSRWYEGLLAREREAAARFRAGLPPALAPRFETLHRQLDEASLRLVAARQRIGNLAYLRAAELRAAVATEVRRLDAYEAELSAVTSASNGLVGTMAARAVRRVATALDDVAVEADAGLSDVAWVRKRQRAEAIRRLAEEKDRAVGELDADRDGRAGVVP